MYRQKLNFGLKKLVIVSFLFIYQSANAQSFTLNGTITGNDNGIVILYYRNADNVPCSDTTTIKQGKFQFTGTVSGVDYAMLNTDTNYTKGDNTYNRGLYIEPGVMNISFAYGDLKNAKITGSKTQTASDAFYKKNQKIIKESKTLSLSADSIRHHLKNGSIDPALADKKIKEINEKYAPVWKSYFNNNLLYINRHPGSYVSLMLLKYSIGAMSNDSVDIFYAKLSDKVKNSSLDYGFLEYYATYKKAIGEEYPFDKIKMNEPAPIFTVYNGQDTMSLQSLKGKILLLEFWELTCLPCLQANPQLETIRKKYSSEGFQIIGITSTSIKELPKLITYINRNNFSDWINVSTNSEGSKEAKEIYGGSFTNYASLGVPKSILIDKNGKVIYKSFGYSERTIQDLDAVISEMVNGGK